MWILGVTKAAETGQTSEALELRISATLFISSLTALEIAKLRVPKDMGIVATQVYPYGRQIVPCQWTNFDEFDE